MTENSHNENNSTRNFDWGPPSNKTSDKLKEWLVYVFLLIILGAGIWGLLDLKSKKSVLSTPTKIPSIAKQENSEQNVSLDNAGIYIVQLGAFSNEETARAAYKSLVSKGYFPDFAEPDDEYEIYRVSLGPYQSEKEANKVSENLNSLDFSCFVVESP